MRREQHLCSMPGCTTIVDDGPGRCGAHHRRRPGDNAYYKRRWRNVRDAYLRAHPVCECADPACNARAVEVHHRDHRGPAGPRGLDWSNLQALTVRCHRRLTAEHYRRVKAGHSRREAVPATHRRRPARASVAPGVGRHERRGKSVTGSRVPNLSEIRPVSRGFQRKESNELRDD